MAIICPKCGTENRSVAKFCIECIAQLPARFEPTQLLVPPPDDGADEMPSALAAFAAAGPAVSRPQGPMHPSQWPSAAPPASSKGWGVGVALGALLLAGAIGWFAAGGSLRSGKGAAPSPQAAAAAAPAPAQRQVAGTLAPPEQAPAEVLRADARPTLVEALAPGEVIVPAGASPAPPRPVMAAAVKPLPAAPKVERSQDLFVQCEGLGFIFVSRCRVELCQQSANRERRECQPVLAQQRAMEEKRNPTN